MPKVHEEIGDALRGDKIAVKAKKIGKGPLLQGSSRHRIQTRVLEDEVFCVIQLPLVYFRK